MRLFLTGALLVAATASQASAQIAFSSTAGNVVAAGQTVFLNFDLLTPGSVTFGGNYSILSGTTSGIAAAPFGGSGNYFAVPKTSNSGAVETWTATINFQNFIAGRALKSLSFLWGSVDTYNTLQLLDANGNVLEDGLNNILANTTILGGQLPPANGDQGNAATNRRLQLNFSGSAATDFSQLRFTSSQRAFEVDDFAAEFVVDRVEVPEPATLSMLTFGIAMLGVAGARRKRNATV